jgi:hypothetical protein
MEAPDFAFLVLAHEDVLEPRGRLPATVTAVQLEPHPARRDSNGGKMEGRIRCTGSQRQKRCKRRKGPAKTKTESDAVCTRSALQHPCERERRKRPEFRLLVLSDKGTKKIESLAGQFSRGIS